MNYRVELTETAEAALKALPDRRIQQELLSQMAALKDVPEQQGKPLSGALRGYWSTRASNQRYRILYRIDRGAVIVVVVFCGLRKEDDRKRDVYKLAQKLLKAGLLE